MIKLKLTAIAVWSDLRRLEVFLVGFLNAWAIVAAFMHSIGVPAQVASAAAAALGLVALLLQYALTASTSGGVPAFLVAVVTAWAVVASLLGQVGVPVKVTAVIGAGLAVVALIVQRGVAAKVNAGPPAVYRSA